MFPGIKDKVLVSIANFHFHDKCTVNNMSNPWYSQIKGMDTL